MNWKKGLKKWGLAGLAAVLLLLQNDGSAAASENKKEAVLKVDREDVQQLPRNFRTSNDAFKAQTGKTLPSRVGLDTLRESGSSIFSEKEFEEVLKRLPQGKVIVVDLRQESHGYLNGTAVSWFGENNWGNDGMSLEQVKPVERSLLDKALAASPVAVRHFNDAKDRPEDEFRLEVKSARTEEEMVRQHGADYFRLAVPDHFRPDDADVDRFIQFSKTLPKDAWLHFHCFAGQGRTTIFMVMYDILKNAKKLSYDEIVYRQALIGVVDLRSIPDSKKNWKKKAYVERAQFTKHFYDYVRQSPEGLPQSWSEWAKKHDY